MAIVHGLYRNIVNIDMYIESEPFKVQVSLTFSGTMSFPRHRDGRYYVTKGHSLQIKREDNSVNVIFESEAFRAIGSGYAIQLVKNNRRCYGVHRF